MYKVKLVDVNHYTPSNKISNNDLGKIVDTDDEWIQTRTGIKNRRISLGENTSDLAYQACKDLDVKNVDLIIFATFTPDKLAPATASILQKKLGIENASCLDINAGCTGFIYSLKVATAMISSGMHKKVLVVGGEVISKATDWNDRGTCVLFGDGAGAFVLEQSDIEKIYSIHTDGIIDCDDCLYVEGLENSNFMHQGEPTHQVIKMDGVKVFKFATKVVSEAIEKALTDADLTIDDIKVIIPHQANERIIKSVSKSNKIPLDKFYLNISEYGNTSSASIPIAFSEALKDGTIVRGDKVLLVGFGAGLTWGATIIEY